MGMSVAEYEHQKTTGRFRILDVGDAQPMNVPGADCYDEDWRGLVVEFVDDKPVRIVGSDGGAPEDQCLTRDWQWVAVELNALAEARAIGELELEVANASIAAYHAALECVEEEAELYRIKRRDAVRRLIKARAATGEPKEE